MKVKIALLLATLAAFGSGCGGVSVHKTVSPLDFFLPGILKNTPPTPSVPGDTNSVPVLALATTGYSVKP